VLLIASYFLLFLTFALTGRLDYGAAGFCFVLFSFLSYVYFGRYLARVTIHHHSIQITYLFPWQSSSTFTFKSLLSIRCKDRPLLTDSDRWYRSYQTLHLINEKGEAWQAHYQIDEASQQLLVQTLGKLEYANAETGFVK
ncbi:MAG TPA: hypothetical protein VD794_04215, partial [Flavisolibacter sp.]|nr:hypothetical protein [Flavisolibacter sp.]